MPVFGTLKGTGVATRGFAAATLVLLAGCAGRPNGVMLPVADVESVTGK